MRSRKTRRNYGQEDAVNETKAMGVPGHYYPKDIKLLTFLFNEYGSWEFILRMADSIADLLYRILKRSKAIKFIIIALKYAIPVSVFTVDFISKIKKFRKIKFGEDNVVNEHDDKIRSLIDCVDVNSNIDYTDISFGVEVNKWLLDRPNTKSFKIKGYYQYENLEPVHDLGNDASKALIIVFEFENCKFAWILRMGRTYSDDLYTAESRFNYYVGNINKIDRLKHCIYREFIEHLDINKNIIIMEPAGITIEPRQEVVERIDQYDINHLSETIRKVLSLGKKRGIGFVGVPGTGKSTLIKKLEMIITEYPIIYLSPDCFYSSNTVRETFNTISYIQPCIAVIEDLDSCDVKDKRAVLGELLDQIDDVDNRLNIVLLTSINDTSLVHYSLINRPGRFDEIILIKPPFTMEEIYSIMLCRYNKNKEIDPNIFNLFLKAKEIDPSIFDEIIKNKYTHADICEIIEKALLISYDLNNDVLKESLNYFNSSKEALRECDFGGNNPMTDRFEKEDECPAPPLQCRG